MDEPRSSTSDQQITSLITTSITDMVRKEVAKIMHEFNMPVDDESVDRVIAENLDKQVEMQNYVKTFKRKFNQFSQYKCVDTSADPDDIVLTSLQLIENRVKKLEDLVFKNSKENLMHRQLSSGKFYEDVNVKAHQNESGSTMEKQNKLAALLNLDEVIRIIKDCPETQESFEIFQTAAERIKYDLELFIKEFKSNLSNCTRRRQQAGDDAVANDNNDSKETTNHNEPVNKRKKTKISQAPVECLVSTEKVNFISTSLEACAKKSSMLLLHEPDSDDDDDVDGEGEGEAAVETVSEKMSSPPKTDETAVVEEIVIQTIDMSAENIAEASKACGDKTKSNYTKEYKLVKTRTKDQITKNAPVIEQQLTDNTEQQHKPCKECLKRNQKRTYAIDEDIKWKLDKILDQIGDFCSRTKSSNKESVSEPDPTRQLTRNSPTASKPPIQPGTSAELVKSRRISRSSSVRPRQTPQRDISPHNREEFCRECHYKEPAAPAPPPPSARSSKPERKYNLDKVIERIRADVSRQSQQTLPPMSMQDIPPQSIILKKPNERLSLDAFKAKWSQERSRNLANRNPSQIDADTESTTMSTTSRKRSTRRNSLHVALPSPQHHATKSNTTLMLESIDRLARKAALSARMARESNEFSYVYSRRPTLPPTADVNLSENRVTKVLYHNYKV